MKAFAIDRYAGTDALALRDIPAPLLSRGQVLVRVHAASLNPADLTVLSGRGGARFLHAARFPLVLGYDFSGVIERAGAEAGGFERGDSVFGFLPYSRTTRQGTCAEFVAVPVTIIAKKPPEVSHAEAACAATAASTALQALRDEGGLGNTAETRVLVNGASGGVGSYAVQIAKIEGAIVWGTSSQAKTEFVSQLGADRVLDHSAVSLGRLNEHFDIVVDVASKSSFSECRRILAPAGRYVTLLPSLDLVTGKLEAAFGSKSCSLVAVQPRASDLEQVARWMSAGKLESHIDSTYRLTDLPDAMRRLESGRVCGKVAVTIR